VLRPTLLAILALLAPASALAATPGTWTRLHAGNAPDAEPGLARTADGRLHVAWQQIAGAQAQLVHQAFSRTGDPVGTRDVVAGGWQAINPHVELVAAGSQLRAVWAGAAQGSPSGPVVSSASTGGGWSVPTPMTTALTAASATGIGAAAAADGTVAAAHGDAAPGTNRFRVGAGAETAFETAGCCATEPDMAADAATGKLFLGWYSTAPGRRGLWTQEISTAGLVGTRTRVAGSSNADGSAAVRPGQRTAITSRIGAGGVYVAYGGGYPAFDSVNLLRLGRTPVVVARGDRIEHVGAAPGPQGRLWLFWSRGDGYLVTRSNKAVTRFESLTHVALPAGGTTTYGLYGEGSGGPLDLVAHAGSGAAIPDWHTQVLPRLSLVVLSSRTDVRGRGKSKHAVRRLALRVTDAGDPVGGARITLGGKRFTTAASGRVTAVLPVAGRQLSATAAKAGYASATARLRI
jgi:hypothetical protein